MGAVFVTHDDGDGDLGVGEQPALLVGLGKLSVEAFQDALGDARGCPIQVGVASTRMSAAISWARIVGQWSPVPMSTSTPGRTSWSTARMRAPDASCVANSARTCSVISWLLDGAGAERKVQTRAKAVRVAGSVTQMFSPHKRRARIRGRQDPDLGMRSPHTSLVLFAGAVAVHGWTRSPGSPTGSKRKCGMEAVDYNDPYDVSNIEWNVPSDRRAHPDYTLNCEEPINVQHTACQGNESPSTPPLAG